ncbi:hypothetical protein Tco_0629488 [Tanacetum coccineum]|uniref:Zinc finger, CCHC-type n=1 Tax=Tanacetum coccineum TaxID=301880 RepID=A0ABQ4WT88_9ASTR
MYFHLIIGNSSLINLRLFSKHDKDSDSSDDEGNTYFGEALVVVRNDEMTKLVMDSGGSYHMTHMRDFLYDFKVVDGGLRRSLIPLGTLKKRGLYCEYVDGWNQGDQRLSGYDDWDQEKELCVYFGSKSDDFRFGFKQLGPGVEIGVDGVQVEKHVWFEVELQEAQGDREVKFFQVSNDDAIVAQRRLENKQLE